MATQYKVDIGTNPNQVPINGMLGTAAFIDEEQLQVYSADTATKLDTGRTISITGDLSYTSGSFDGTANVSGTGTLATTGVSAGTYKSVTVDTKGRVTAGTNPTTLSGYGITDAQPLDATLTSLAGVTTAADKVIYATAPDTFTTMTVTSAARSVLDDTSVSAMLATMGGAPLASPALTGTPTAPTATAGTNTTQIATTAFVTTAVANAAPTTSQVLSAIAGASAGSVGTYVIAVDYNGTGTSLGGTRPGSSLSPASTYGSTSGGVTLSGTWRCMGHAAGSLDPTSSNTTLWLRIS